MEREHKWIAELEAGTLAGIYSIRSIHVRKHRKGFYLDLVLFDRSGAIPAKYWNAHPNMLDHVAVGDFLRISGQAEESGETLQVIINDFAIAEDHEIQAHRYERVSDHDPAASLSELYEILKTVEDSTLFELVEAFLFDDEFVELFLVTPGSYRRHHAWSGGLVDHVLSIVKLADLAASHYPELNRDLLLVGAFVHDLGKVIEFDWDGEAKTSLAGRMLGHIPLGIELLTRKADECDDFPEDTLLLLKHMVYAHHESARYGSPKAPMIPEALVLQSLEALDSRLSTMFETLESPASETLEAGTLHRGHTGARLAFKPKAHVEESPAED